LLTKEERTGKKECLSISQTIISPLSLEGMGTWQQNVSKESTPENRSPLPGPLLYNALRHKVALTSPPTRFGAIKSGEKLSSLPLILNKPLIGVKI